MRKTIKAVHPVDFQFLSNVLDQIPRIVTMDFWDISIAYKILEIPGNIYLMSDETTPRGELRLKLDVDLEDDHIRIV